MDNQKPSPYEGRPISGVYVNDLAPFLLSDKAGISGDVAIFLVPKDGKTTTRTGELSEGPKLQLTVAFDFPPNTTIDEIYLRIFQQAHGLVKRIAQETPESLLEHMKATLTETIEKFSDD